MSNRLFLKITSTLAFLSHSSAPPPHTFLRSPSLPKRLLHDLQTNPSTVLQELRHQGADRVWPRRINDDDFSAAFRYIAAKASANLHVPLPLAKDVLRSLWLPRMEWIMEQAIEWNMISSLPIELSTGSIAYMWYLEYKGEWKFRGSRIMDLPEWAEYEAFQVLLRDARPKGFAKNPEEIGGFRYVAPWSMDGVQWSKVGDEEEFRELYKKCLKNEGGEFTVLFLENHLVPPQGQDLRITPWLLE